MAKAGRSRTSFLLATTLVAASVTAATGPYSAALPGPHVDTASNAGVGNIVTVEIANFLPSKAKFIDCTLLAPGTQGPPTDLMELPNTRSMWKAQARIPWIQDPGRNTLTCRAGSTKASDRIVIQPSYQVQSLLVPNSSKTILTGIDDVGQATGYFTNSSNVQQGFTYSGGQYQVLASSATEQSLGSGFVRPQSTSPPIVVGQHANAPAIYQTGAWQPLALPQGRTTGRAVAGVGGYAVGYGGNGTSEPFDPLYWNLANGDATPFKDLPNATGGQALALNTKMIAAGGEDLQGGETHAADWPSWASPVMDLGTFGGHQSIARGMNDRNVVVGTAGGPNDTVFYGFTYRIGGSGLEKFPGLGGSSTAGNAINNDSQVVGASLLQGDQVGHAFEFANGVTFDLNKFLPKGAGPVEVATSINPWGEIGAWGNVGNVPHGFILTPTMGVEKIDISDQGFAPMKLTACIGSVVQWVNNGPGDHGVSDSTGLKLFASGQMHEYAGFHFKVTGAGTYTYSDPSMPSLTGAISVPLEIAPTRAPLGTAYQIRWAYQYAPKGLSYDLQLKYPGAKSYVDWKLGTKDPESFFLPKRKGTYEFRARLWEPSLHAYSDWSPDATLQVV